MIGRTARDLAADVRTGARTPHEVVAAHLAAIDRWDAHLGAFVSVRRDAALAEADALGARFDLDRLSLAGVPVAIKDVVDVTGEPSRHGSAALPSPPASDDDPTVSRLRAAGAIVVGKTRGPELGLWGTSDGPDGISLSPWDTSRTAGGSSGGSAAAVAAGLVPVALGSDLLGSVRIPAAACGLFGIKPGGLVPVALGGGDGHWFGMSQHGALATTVADAALFLDVIAASAHHRDPAPPDRRLRVAVSVRSPAAGVPVGGAWRDAALEAGRLLRVGGHDVHLADPPYGTARTAAALLGRWLQGAAQDVVTLGAERERLQARTRRHVAVGRRLGRIAPVREEGARRWQASVAAFFADHDVLVTPTFARSALPAIDWHRRGWAANVAANLSAYPFTGPWNLADCPAAAVPMGLADGRPLSVQVVAAQGREDLVLAVARQLEQARPWTRHAPGWAVLH